MEPSTRLSSFTKMSCKLVVLICFLAVTNARSLSDVNLSISPLSSRIIGGHDAEPGQFPHQVSLQVTEIEGGLLYEHYCAGAILNKEWVLTAGHCVDAIKHADSRTIFTVMAGKHNLKSSEQYEQVSLVDKYFIHHLFDKKVLGVSPYDIGLIKLGTPLEFNECVAPIRLPKKNTEPEGKVILSGWGFVSNASKPKIPAILQTADLEIVDRQSCNQAIRKVYEENGFEIEFDLIGKTNICSGPIDGSKSVCAGDSGGPLISKDSNGKTELVGIVSWGMQPCGRDGAPSVYIRTSFFVDWIQAIIGNN